MRVSVFGLGYVGCVTAACLARAGHEVVGVDVNPDKVAMINAGQSPIVEPGLGELLEEMVTRKRLRATCSSEAAIAAHRSRAHLCRHARRTSNGQPDFSAVARVAEQIGQGLRGRTRPLHRRVAQHRPAGHDGRPPAARASRRMRPGARRATCTSRSIRSSCARARRCATSRNPPLTLVGCEDSDTANALRSLYMCVNAPFVQTGIAEAEMIKYVSNTFHALKVCFANEIGDLCARRSAPIRRRSRASS